MGAAETPRGVRRRALAVVMAAGVVVGAAAGTALFVGASPDPAGGPAPTVLHAAPALVDARRPVELSVASVCAAPDTPSCRVNGATAFVRPASTAGWTAIEGEPVPGAFRFHVAAELVPAEGFWYWLRLTTDTGDEVSYPPGGETAAIRVVTISGLPVRPLGAFDWDRRLASAGTVVRAGYGNGAAQVGRRPGGIDRVPAGPSSFDVGAHGEIYVADWINRRVQVFDPSGDIARSFAMPERRPMDLSTAPGGGVVLGTLGTEASVFELDPRGRVLGRYPVAYGVSARVAATPAGPRVLTGAAQWASVRADVGAPLPAEAQASAQTTSIPLTDGGVAASQELPGARVAFVWTRPDGSRAGVVVGLPRGVAAGSDFFVRPTADGGAIAARGLWDATHNGVAVIRFDVNGRVSSFALLPEPSTEPDARFSLVRFQPPSSVLEVLSDEHGYRIERFEVKP